MRRQRRQKVKSAVTARLWSYAQVEKAVPYLRSIVQSLRERWLEMQRARREVRLRDSVPGRLSRQALILRQTASLEAELTEERFNETLAELEAIHARCIDPARGLAWIPFREGDELAWIILDLFAPQPLAGWRLQGDPVDTLRPLAGFDMDRIVATDYVFARGAEPRS
jgi:hypothetical protein